MSSESPGDPRLLERLEESVSGSAALRQLSRRYSLLHADYERLLSRLEELEGELRTPAPTPAVAEDPQLTRGVATPLIEMGGHYAEAAAEMLRVVEGLHSLAAGGSPSAAPHTEAATGEHARWRGIDVEVTTPTFDELVEFQDRLMATAGVQRVSIRAIEDNVATLLVELREPEVEARPEG